MSKARRPADLGNDQMFIRTDSNGMLSSAGTRAVLDLNLKKDRAIVRRFAQRLLDICDWWEAKGQ
jgi:hypothetical protein